MFPWGLNKYNLSQEENVSSPLTPARRLMCVCVCMYVLGDVVMMKLRLELKNR